MASRFVRTIARMQSRLSFKLEAAILTLFAPTLPLEDVILLLKIYLPETLKGVGNFCRKAQFYLYKTRERIHRGLLIRDYYQVQLHAGEFQPTI